jgi:hypothetical protein
MSVNNSQTKKTFRLFLAHIQMAINLLSDSSGFTQASKQIGFKNLKAI